MAINAVKFIDEKNESKWEALSLEEKRSAQKAEAIERMRILNYFKQSINEFVRADRVMLNELPFGAHFYIDNEKDGQIKRMIDGFEQQYTALVYAVTHTFFEFGECYEFFFVSNYPEEWEYEREEMTDGYAMVYVYNHSVEWCSEFGTIAFAKTMAGGIRRTA